jgi:hypothetical protein
LGRRRASVIDGVRSLSAAPRSRPSREIRDWLRTALSFCTPLRAPFEQRLTPESCRPIAIGIRLCAPPMHDKYLYAGLIRLHVFHHAAKEPIYGLAVIEDLERHGTRSAPARSTRSCTGSKAKDISPQPKSAAAAARAASIAPRPREPRRLPRPNSRCGNCSASCSMTIPPPESPHHKRRRK